MMSEKVPDVPPPGEGLKTVMDPNPELAMSLGGMVAVNLVLLTTTVLRAAPPQRTTELDIKLEPLTVNVRALLPAGMFKGDTSERVGLGFWVTGLEEDLLLPPQLMTDSASKPMQPRVKNRCFGICSRVFNLVVDSFKIFVSAISLTGSL
jgi:hypothetical protein